MRQRLAEDYSIESYASDVLAVVDGLHVERPRLVGMSLGEPWRASSRCATRSHRKPRDGRCDLAAGVRRYGADARLHDGLSWRSERGGSGRDGDAVSPGSDPERVRYRMQNLLRRGEDGRLVWKRDVRRPSDYPMILAHLAGFEPRRGHQRAVPVARAPQPHHHRSRARDFTARFPDGRWIDIRDAGHMSRRTIPAIWPTH